MNPQHLRARLYVLGAAILVFLGGMIFAVARWNSAEADRAFIAAATRAASQPASAAAPARPRFWMPAASDRPRPAATAAIEAAERLRTMPAAPRPAAAPATQGQGRSETAKPPAAAP